MTLLLDDDVVTSVFDWQAAVAALWVAYADRSFPVLSAETAEAAVGEATLVVCAARSRDELLTLRGSWLRPGMTVVSIGSTLPEQSGQAGRVRDQHYVSRVLRRAQP